MTKHDIVYFVTFMLIKGVDDEKANFFFRTFLNRDGSILVSTCFTKAHKKGINFMDYRKGLLVFICSR